MKNTTLVKEIVEYIGNVIKERRLSQNAVAQLSKEPNSISQGSISNILKNPSSARLSTLLNLCDALDLNLQTIIRSIQREQTSNNSAKESSMIYSADERAYNGYKAKYHIYYISTVDTRSNKLMHGTIMIDDFYDTNECSARLTIYTGQKQKDGTPFIKEFEGPFFISYSGCMFFNLTCDKYGDIWSLVFNHSQLNENKLAFAIGCGVTSSAGKQKLPAIHRVCLCHEELKPEYREYIVGLLRVYNEDIFITPTMLDKFQAQEDLPEKVYNFLSIFKSVNGAQLPHSTDNNLIQPAYLITTDLVKTISPTEDYLKVLSKLLSFSLNETCYKNPADIDEKLHKLIDLQL